MTSTGYQPFTNESETATSTNYHDMNNAYPDLDLPTTASDGQVNQTSELGTVKIFRNFSIATKPLALFLVIFNLIAHIWSVSAAEPEKYKLRQPTDSDKMVSTVWHITIVLEAILSVLALYGIFKNVASYIHWYICWCCFETAIEVIIAAFILWLLSMVKAFTIKVFFAFAMIGFSLFEIYVLMVHYRFVKAEFPQNNAASLFKDIQYFIQRLRR